MRVLLHLVGELGHHLPSFPLGRALAARGHEVVYLATRDMQREIEARGFRYAPVYDDVWPLGTMAAHNQLTPEDLASAVMVRRKRMLDERVRELVERRIREIEPDVALVDNIARDVVLLVHRLGLPCLRISASLPLALDDVPPIACTLAPDADHFQLEIERHRAPLCFAQPAMLADLSIQVARDGYPPREVAVRSSLVPELSRYPLATLCEEPFDFPRRDRPLYCAHRPELDRPESVDDELRGFVGEHAVIAMSLGSQSGRYGHAPAVYQALVDTMRAHPEWRAVVGASERYFRHACLASAPSNVLVRSYVPQLWLLRRARAFVTHAGLGSVREAIALRVPMIAIPQMYDQPGNAARVAHHGIGICLPPETVTTPRLEAALASLLDDARGYRARIALLDAACQRSVEQIDTVAIVEAAARSAPPRRPARPALQPGPAGLGWVFTDAQGRLAEGGTLRAGQTLARADDRAPAVGAAGWVVCPSIGDALSRAIGPVAARVVVAGPAVADGPYVATGALRCLWTVDLEAELVAYADWCAEQVLEQERAADPVTFAGFQDGLARLRSLVASGAAPAEVAAARKAFDDRYTWLWYRDYTAAPAMASAHDAARFARWHALGRLALRAAWALVPAGAGAEVFASAHAAATARADAELLRRVALRARAAGIDV